MILRGLYATRQTCYGVARFPRSTDMKETSDMKSQKSDPAAVKKTRVKKAPETETATPVVEEKVVKFRRARTAKPPIDMPLPIVVPEAEMSWQPPAPSHPLQSVQGSLIRSISNQVAGFVKAKKPFFISVSWPEGTNEKPKAAYFELIEICTEGFMLRIVSSAHGAMIGTPIFLPLHHLQSIMVLSPDQLGRSPV